MKKINFKVTPIVSAAGAGGLGLGAMIALNTRDATIVQSIGVPVAFAIGTMLLSYIIYTFIRRSPK